MMDFITAQQRINIKNKPSNKFLTAFGWIFLNIMTWAILMEITSKIGN